MNPARKKRQSVGEAERVEVVFLQVEIGTPGKQHDHFADLVLKHAKDILKDALVTTAESHGGKLSCWENDSGTFLFRIESPDSLSRCCAAAFDMLAQLPAVKKEVQLSADLQHLILVRIRCDTGTVVGESEGHAFAGDFLDQLKRNKSVVGAENQVTITDRIFRQLKNPLKSAFVNWKHSTELGADLYAAAQAPEKLDTALPAWSAEQGHPAENEQPRPDGPVPIPSGTEGSSAPARFRLASPVLQSRKALTIAGAALLLVVIGGLVRHFAWPTTIQSDPAQQTPAWEELVQSADWQNWRKQIHEKLSAGPVTEKTLADALSKLPTHADNAPAALRRDQAVADVLMSYRGVRELLWKRFGIDENGFLGTGLSKPSSALDYRTATIHEYLIPNHYADDRAVWMAKLDPIQDGKYLDMTVQEFCKNAPKLDDKKKNLLEEVKQRIEKRGKANPAVIRFARFDAVHFSRKLGPLDRYRVFASNLAELWNTRLRDAADLSGHTFTKGDTVFIWIFLPNHPVEVVPATWGEVLSHLPGWLQENDKQ